MAGSILKDTKKLLGLGDVTDEFDTDILIHINTAFTTLTELGIGPAEGFTVEDASATWDEFLQSDKQLNSVKTYIYMKVRLVFDPPATSFHIAALERQIEQIEFRLSVKRENESWTPPVSTIPAPEPEVIIIPADQAWASE